MHVSVIPEHATGKHLMQYVTSTRKGKKTKKTTEETIGYVEDFLDRYDDPVAHFKAEAKRITAERKAQQKTIGVELQPDARLPFDPDTHSFSREFNIGHAAISQVFHTLDLHTFFDRRRIKLDVQFNLTAVMKLLIYERILAPASKRATWKSRRRYFDKMDFNLNAVYQTLSHINPWTDDLIAHLHAKMVELYDRDTTLMYYDVTNYYFEIDEADDFRIRGICKEHRPLPIVQMGLFMDEQGFPVSFDLFPGNVNDCLTFEAMSEHARTLFEAKHLIFVADKAMLTGNNIADVILHHNGYVFSKSVRGGTKKLKQAVRDPHGYLRFAEDGKLIAPGDNETAVWSKYKILDEQKPTYVTNTDGKRVASSGVGHYQIIYWSRAYDKRAKAQRLEAVEHALDASSRQSKEVIDSNYGKNKYLMTMVYDPQTKKYTDNYKAKTEFDAAKLEEDESFDGFYVIETNVTGLRPFVDARGHETGELEPAFATPHRWLKEEGMLQLNRPIGPLDIITMYHGLWKIEQSFRVTKSELDARPVFLSLEDRIHSHFLTCFIALLILRILEHELDHEFSTEQIGTSLNQANVAEITGATYMTLQYDEVQKALKEKMGIPFGMNVYSRAAIKKMIAETKKNRKR